MAVRIGVLGGTGRWGANIVRTIGDLNGTELRLGAADALPSLAGAPIAAGSVALAPATITFLAVPGAGNASCR